MKRHIGLFALCAFGIGLVAPAEISAQGGFMRNLEEKSKAQQEEEEDKAKAAESVKKPSPAPRGWVGPASKPEPKPEPQVTKPSRPARPGREQTVRPERPPRRRSELHPNWPIKRPPRETILRRRRDRDRIPPILFLPPVFFGGIVIDNRYDPRYGYRRDRLTWADSETLYREDDWVEFVLDCNARGEKLWFEVRDGRVRIEWAEIVFENGEAQVVDFSERSIGPGLYVLLDFRDGRRVDHVRMVAQAATREVELTLRMER